MARTIAVSTGQLVTMLTWMEYMAEADDTLSEEIFRARRSVSVAAAREALQAAESAMASTTWDSSDQRVYDQISRRV